MGNFNIGQFVYLSRKAQGLTQEQVCESANGEKCCSTETLSRIECGKQRPNYQTMRKLMKRLGKENCFCNPCLKTDDYCVLVWNRELKRTITLNNFEKADKILQKLEERLSLKYVTNRQYLLRTHALIDRMLKRITPQESLELLEIALRMSVRSYGTKLFRHELLVPQEVIIVCNIANNYGAIGELDKALKLLRILMNMLHDKERQQHYPDNLVAVVERNWIRWTGEQKRYAEAVASSSQAIRFWAKNGLATTLPGLYYARAYNLHKLKESSPDWQDYDNRKIYFDLEMCVQMDTLFRHEKGKELALEKMENWKE